MQILGRSAAYLQLADTFPLTAWLSFGFVSLCHLFTLSLASLPVFNGWERQWRKEGRGRRTEGGRGLPSPGGAFNEEPLKSGVIEQLLRKRRRVAPLRGRAVVPFLFTFLSHLSLLIFYLYSVSSRQDLHLLLLLVPTTDLPFTSCPPLWSGHGSRLYFTEHGGRILLAAALLSPGVCVWVCVCVVGGQIARPQRTERAGAAHLPQYWSYVVTTKSTSPTPQPNRCSAPVFLLGWQPFRGLNRMSASDYFEFRALNEWTLQLSHF